MIDQPEEARVTLEQIKNQITLSEGELKRLQDLRASEEYTISELVKNKRFEQDEVTRLQSEKDSLIQQLTEIKSVLQKARDYIQQSEETKAQLEKAQADLVANSQQQQEAADTRSKELDAREQTLATSENDHQVARSALQQRAAAIVTILEKLRAFDAEIRSDLANLGPEGQ